MESYVFFTLNFRTLDIVMMQCWYLQGVLAGKSSGSEEKCLEDQLRDAKAMAGDAESELKQLKTKISHSEKELKEKKGQLNSKRDEAAAVEKELDFRKKDVENVRTAIESTAYEEGQMEALEKVINLFLLVIILMKLMLKGPEGYLLVPCLNFKCYCYLIKQSHLKNYGVDIFLRIDQLSYRWFRS